MRHEFPLVTIVVPAYNHEDYIVDCISSILDQDWPCIEVIVINDGSTDKTDQKIKDFMRDSGASFNYISKPNEGLVKTLNLALKLSKGKYFCELASDDMLLPGSIRKRVEYLESNPALDAVFADVYFTDGSVRSNKRMLGKRKPGYTSATHCMEDIIRGDAAIIFPTGMIKKSVLVELGGFDEDFRYYEDKYMKYLLAIRGKVGFLDESVMYYRKHKSNVSRTFAVPKIKEKILSLEKFLSCREAFLFRKGIKKKLSREYWEYYKVGLRNGVDKAKLVMALKNSIKNRPFHYKTLRSFYCLIKIMLKKSFLS